METTKICKKCKEELPIGAFGLYSNGNKNAKYFRSDCRKCLCNKRKKQYSESQEYRAGAIERAAKWAKENKERKAKTSRKATLNYRIRCGDKIKAKSKTKSICLADSYIKRLMAAGTSLKFNEIPDELVNLKRAQIKIARKLREIKNAGQ